MSVDGAKTILASPSSQFERGSNMMIMARLKVDQNLVRGGILTINIIYIFITNVYFVGSLVLIMISYDVEVEINFLLLPLSP